VRNALEVDQIFDHISYLKGSSVIRMLSNHLGQDIFLKGVGDYLKLHAYGNARTDDLWDALSKASGQDVKSFMDPWIKKIGFPVVTIAEEPGQISLKQTRFLTTGDVKSEEDETTWWIPVGLKTSTPEKIVHSALTKKEDTVRNVDDDFYKINADQTGFYRTNYPPQRLLKLGQSRARLSDEDKIGLMGDASALAIAGHGTTPALLSLLEGFQDEQSYLVWAQIASSIAKIKQVFAGNKEVADGIKKFTLKLISPATEKIGWEYPKDEEWLSGQLRKLLIGLAANNGHEATAAEGKKRFEAWKSGDDKAIHQNLRSVVFNLAVAQGGKSEWNTIKDEYLKTSSVDGKEICLVALGRSRDKTLVTELLDFATSDTVPTQDSHSAIASVAGNNECRIVAWEYTRDHWERVQKRLGVANIVLDRWMKMGLPNYSDMAVEKDISNFFRDKDTSAFARSLVIISDNITANANYKARDEQKLLEWLKANGYA
jgi:aminopeptidase N